jgi:putative Mg2+ transporter-C (MgtC) family protein
MAFEILTSLSMLLHITVACALGWVVGYERYFHGRSSGSQVYCLVCMASSALTQIAGYPELWYGGHTHELTANPFGIIGSILTGIGFLGAGIIVKSGTSVRGLTTAASIWSSSAIGILIGVNFYILAIGLTVLFALCMVAIPALEHALPARAAMVVTLRYAEGKQPQEGVVLAYLKSRQLAMLPDSLSVGFDGRAFELRFVVLADSVSRSRSISHVSHDLTEIPEVSSFGIEQTSRA